MDKKLNEDSTLVKGKSGIKIKKANKGKFTDYCGGKVTDECILKGLNSSDPAVRKRANFARNARKWKHGEGGYLHTFKIRPNHVMDSNPKLDNMKKKYEEGGFFKDSANMDAFASNLGGIVNGIAGSIANSKAFKKIKDSIIGAGNQAKLSASREALDYGNKIFNEQLKSILELTDTLFGTNDSKSSIVYNSWSNLAGKPYIKKIKQLIDDRVLEALKQVSLKEQESYNQNANSIINSVQGIADVFSKYKLKTQQDKQLVKNNTLVSQASVYETASDPSSIYLDYLNTSYNIPGGYNFYDYMQWQ